MGDFSKLQIARELPPAGDYTDRASDLFEAMVGARIVDIGAPFGGDRRIEGGGLVVEFIPAGDTAKRRVVFGFNEGGMWIEFDSSKSTP